MFGTFRRTSATSNSSSGTLLTKNNFRFASRGSRRASKESLQSEAPNERSRRVDRKVSDLDSVFATVPSVINFNEASQCFSDDVFATAPAVMCTFTGDENKHTSNSVPTMPRSESRLPQRASSRAPVRDATSRAQIARSKSVQRNKEIETPSPQEINACGRETEDAVRKMNSDPVRKLSSGPKNGLYRYEKVKPPPPLEVEKEAPIPSLGSCPRSLWKRKTDKFAASLENMRLRQFPFRSRAGSISPSRSTTCSPSRRSAKSSKEAIPSSVPSREMSIDALDSSSPVDAPTKTLSNASLKSTLIDIAPLQAVSIQNAAPERTPLADSKAQVNSFHNQADTQSAEHFVKISPRSTAAARTRRLGSQGSRSPRRPLSPGGRRRRRRASAPPTQQTPSEPSEASEPPFTNKPHKPSEPTEPSSNNRARKPSPDRGLSPPPSEEGPGLCRGFVNTVNAKTRQSSASYLDLAGAATPRTSNDAARIFGLETGFGGSEVRAAFMQAAKHWHPDRPAWVNGEASERELATAAFRRARTAYDLLNGREYDGT